MNKVNSKNFLSVIKSQCDLYRSAKPYPHIVIDRFLSEESAIEGSACFPKIEDEGWIHYLHVNEKKHGLNKTDLIPPFFKELISELNSREFIAQLEKLTGISNLLADEMLEGGGLHQSAKGGFLNVHADFTVHPHKRNWKRRVNLLIYFNEGWDEKYLGGLELWDNKMNKAEVVVNPIMNRCVIFNTESDSYHGFPEPIKCPSNMTRKSLALYYFTKENSPIKRATNYKSRPGDGINAIWIYLDKQAINFYNFFKGVFGLNDDFASKILKWISRK